MAIRSIRPNRHALPRRHQHVELDPARPLALSRRRFLQGAVGLTAIGAAAGAGLLRPRLALASGPGLGDVLPLSGGSAVIEGAFGKLFHVFGPPGADSPDSDPATVGNFSGQSGLAYINGMVTETSRKTGASRSLPFIDADMRFMQGVFRGRDGHVRDGTFAFI